MVPVVVAPRARAQIRKAVERWEREHRGETSRLGEEFARVLELLAAFPNLGIGVGRRGRRLLLPDVGYHLYYVYRAERVEVAAVWYAGRGHGPR
jgi:plasmid stabilization system protein ParE